MPAAPALLETPVRGLRLPEAARYVGIGQTKFLSLIGEKRMPGGFLIGGARVWDVRDLDQAFDRLKHTGEKFVDNAWGSEAP